MPRERFHDVVFKVFGQEAITLASVLKCKGCSFVIDMFGVGQEFDCINVWHEA